VNQGRSPGVFASLTQLLKLGKCGGTACEERTPISSNTRRGCREFLAFQCSLTRRRRVGNRYSSILDDRQRSIAIFSSYRSRVNASKSRAALLCSTYASCISSQNPLNKGLARNRLTHPELTPLNLICSNILHNTVSRRTTIFSPRNLDSSATSV
jgi:hypothetical protein